jgi:hypothetical protein
MTDDVRSGSTFGRAFGAALLLGFGVWAAAPLLVGRREPWDATGPFYSLVMVLGGMLIGWWQEGGYVAGYFGAWAGQVLALVFLPAHDESWLSLGLVTTGAGSLLTLAGLALGTGGRRGYRKWWRGSAIIQRWRSIAPERWFLLGFGSLLVLFLLFLLIHPSSVGRGGR